MTHAGARMLIDGELLEAADGREREIVNPASGALLTSVPDAGPADVELAVTAAARAFPAWRDATPRERSERINALADAIAEHAEELGALELANVGKPLSVVREEMPVTVDNLRFFAGAARSLHGPTAGEYLPGRTSFVRREPVGVVGLIVPWNYPLQMAAWKLGPALAMGNTVVLKPSEITPLTALRLAELAADILPAGVLNILSGDGASVGNAIVEHPTVRLVSLTGSLGTGKAIARSAASTVKRVHLELGGNAPLLVFDDADPAAVAAGVRQAAFFNSGQDCTAGTRLLVHENLYEPLLAELLPLVGSLQTGDPADGEHIEMGPLASQAHQRRVLGYLERAAAGGASMLCGGGAPDRAGAFVEPTIVVNVEQTDEIVQSEVFGPVLTVQRFADENAAVVLANGVDYALAASVWTRDLGRALRLSKQLEFGTVWANDHLPFMSEMPHGGFKQSGYGKDLSTYALEDYSQVKHVMLSLD
jgi:betaine-aldehyde dehydrogenase